MRSRAALLQLCLLMCFVLVLGGPDRAFQAATLYVDASAPTSQLETGDPNTPFRAIQTALTAALPNDIILVRAGLYQETIFHFQQVRLLADCAGCDPNIICDPLRKATVADPNTVPVIEGNGLGPVAQIGGFGPRPTFDGFAVRNGGGRIGGGLSVGGDALVCNNLVTGNRAVDRNFAGADTCRGGGACGGGIVVFSTATIQDNMIIGNTAVGGLGGGIAVLGGIPIITRNEIRGNAAQVASDGFYGYGGGIALIGGAPIVTSNVIADNRADQGGGGLDIFGSLAAITGNAITGNEVGSPARGTGRGGGVLTVNRFGERPPDLMNNEIRGNRAWLNGGGVVGLFADPLLATNNLYANEPNDFTGLAGATNPIGVNGNRSVDAADPGQQAMILDAGHRGIICDTDPQDSTCPAPADDGSQHVRVVPLGSLDFAGAARQTDGNGDGIGRSDIGASEVISTDGDGVASPRQLSRSLQSIAVRCRWRRDRRPL